MALVKMSKKEVGAYLEDLQKRVEARWEKTVEKTRFMRELDSGKLPLKTRNLGGGSRDFSRSRQFCTSASFNVPPGIPKRNC